VLLLLVAGALATFVPLWAPLVLAVWVAAMARPLLAKVAKITRGRHRAAGGILVVLVIAILIPAVIVVVSLSRGAADLVRGVLSSKGAKSALIAIVSGSKSSESSADLALLESPEKWLDFVREHGEQAVKIVSDIAGAATDALLGIFIFLYAVYVFLVDGPAQYAWLESHAPLDTRYTRRLAAAFHETGRGLFVGVGLTGLAQGIVATITYLALGVPRALVLGLLTCAASLLPSIGTALVWVPIAAGLALTGRTVSAAILIGVGVFVIGTVDNVLRPVFARFGKLDLSTFVLLTSIFGGLAFFGAWGLVLGPIFARLAKEALIIARTERTLGAQVAETAAASDKPDPSKPA
jgi:predicted PurR-regulated permease PerM